MITSKKLLIERLSSYIDDVLHEFKGNVSKNSLLGVLCSVECLVKLLCEFLQIFAYLNHPILRPNNILLMSDTFVFHEISELLKFSF